jgi:probable F420-dependent oxidoreductase
MQIGVVFPQTEIGDDTGIIRDYAQTAEDLGYSHILAYDHVLGASLRNRPDWTGPYHQEHQFREPLVLFGFIAAITNRIELTTGVLILPQRQTALVAKQAAEVDLLSNGRLRLGVGIGWNHVEYEGLGENFKNRGRRVEEQIELLRDLWTRDAVDFRGTWHEINDAGINPLPSQRPIPIWIGGGADVVLKRIARLGDGWFPPTPPDERGQEMIQKLHEYARAEERDPTTIGIEGRLNINLENQDSWGKVIEDWKSFGATHLSVNTMNSGLLTPSGHIEAIRRFSDMVDW